MSTQMLDWHPSKVLGTNVYQQPVKLWNLRAGLSACKMCPYGAHPHLAVFWATVMCVKWKLADKHAARDHLIRHQRRCQQPQDEVRPYMDVYLVLYVYINGVLGKAAIQSHSLPMDDLNIADPPTTPLVH
eukprot:Em0180g2a